MKYKKIILLIFLFSITFFLFYYLMVNNKPAYFFEQQQISNNNSISTPEIQKDRDEFDEGHAVVVTSLSKEELVDVGIDFWTPGTSFNDSERNLLTDPKNLAVNANFYSPEMPTFRYWIFLDKEKMEFLINHQEVFIVYPHEISDGITN